MCVCLLSLKWLFLAAILGFSEESHKKNCFLNMNHLQPLQRILQTTDLLGFGGDISWYRKNSRASQCSRAFGHMAHARWCRINGTRLLTRERLLKWRSCSSGADVPQHSRFNLFCHIRNVHISVKTNHTFVASTTLSGITGEISSGYVYWFAYLAH